MAEDRAELLEVRELKTYFFTYAGVVKAVDGVGFHLRRGEAIALVGESGCGKSVTALSVMRLVPNPGRTVHGEVIFEGEDLLSKNEREMEDIRGRRISMVFQDPMTSLNPVLSMGVQICEGLARHRDLRGAAARQEAARLLRLVGMPNPERCLNQYPHELSGGMRQRVMIAMAMSCQPRVLILDEPTTALDVSVQAQILDLVKDLKRKTGTSIILITHDLGVVAGLAERVIVMYAGKVVEAGDVRSVYRQPLHPYTVGLLASVPRLDAAGRKRLVPIDGQPPDLLKPPQGCAFWPRCKFAMRICSEEPPLMRGRDGSIASRAPQGQGHGAACWLYHPTALALRKPA